jgi:hypothetical protein
LTPPGHRKRGLASQIHHEADIRFGALAPSLEASVLHDFGQLPVRRVFAGR